MRFPAVGLSLLRVFASDSDWFMTLFTSVVIGQGNSCTTLIWKPLYRYYTVWRIALRNDLKFRSASQKRAKGVVGSRLSNRVIGMQYKHVNGCLTYLWLCNHRIVIYVTSNALVRGLVRRLEMFDFNLADDFVCSHIVDGIDADSVLVPRDFG